MEVLPVHYGDEVSGDRVRILSCDLPPSVAAITNQQKDFFQLHCCYPLQCETHMHRSHYSFVGQQAKAHKTAHTRMTPSNGKRQKNPSAAPPSKGKKARVSSKKKSGSSAMERELEESSSPVLVRRIDYAATHKHPSSAVPCIPLDPDLDTLLYPLKRDEFLKGCLRQRAVHSTCVNGQEEVHARSRVTTIRHEMFDLDPESILRETSSDNVFLWLRKKTPIVEGQERSSSSSSSAAAH